MIIITRNEIITIKLTKLLCQAGFSNIPHITAKFSKTTYILKRFSADVS